MNEAVDQTSDRNRNHADKQDIQTLVFNATRSFGAHDLLLKGNTPDEWRVNVGER